MPKLIQQLLNIIKKIYLCYTEFKFTYSLIVTLMLIPSNNGQNWKLQSIINNQSAYFIEQTLT